MERIDSFTAAQIRELRRLLKEWEEHNRTFGALQVPDCAICAEYAARVAELDKLLEGK